MIKKIAAVLLMAYSIPLFADGSGGGVPVAPDYNPCNVGDWGVIYLVTVSSGCKKFYFTVSCGGLYGNNMTDVNYIGQSPPCQNV
jgi:hypothetical protein